MGVGRDTCPPRVPDLVSGGWQHGSVMGSWGWGGEASSFLSCPLEKTRQGGQGGDFHTSHRSGRSGELSLRQRGRSGVWFLGQVFQATSLNPDLKV